MANLNSLAKQLEQLKARVKPPEAKSPSFLELLREDARDLTNSQARREWEIYHTLSLEEKLDVHRREIERLKANWPGVSEQLQAKFLATEQEMLEELEVKQKKKAEEERKEAEARMAKEGKVGEEGEEKGEEMGAEHTQTASEFSPKGARPQIWTPSPGRGFGGSADDDGEEHSAEPSRVF